MGLAQGEVDFLIIPCSIICLTSFCSSSANAKGTLLEGCRIGLASPMSIPCCTRVVTPKSVSF